MNLFRTEIVDPFFDIPYGFSGTATLPEQIYLLAICHRVIRINKTEQSGFTRSVSSGKRPSLATINSPVQVRDNLFSVVSYRKVLHFHHWFRILPFRVMFFRSIWTENAFFADDIFNFLNPKL